MLLALLLNIWIILCCAKRVVTEHRAWVTGSRSLSNLVAFHVTGDHRKRKTYRIMYACMWIRVRTRVWASEGYRCARLESDMSIYNKHLDWYTPNYFFCSINVYSREVKCGSMWFLCHPCAPDFEHWKWLCLHLLIVYMNNTHQNQSVVIDCHWTVNMAVLKCLLVY